MFFFQVFLHLGNIFEVNSMNSNILGTYNILQAIVNERTFVCRLLRLFQHLKLYF